MWKATFLLIFIQIYLNFQETTAQTFSLSNNNIYNPIIIGVIAFFGFLVLLFLIILLIYCCIYQRKLQQDEEKVIIEEMSKRNKHREVYENSNKKSHVYENDNYEKKVQYTTDSTRVSSSVKMKSQRSRDGDTERIVEPEGVDVTIHEERTEVVLPEVHENVNVTSVSTVQTQQNTTVEHQNNRTVDTVEIVESTYVGDGVQTETFEENLIIRDRPDAYRKDLPSLIYESEPVLRSNAYQSHELSTFSSSIQNRSTERHSSRGGSIYISGENEVTIVDSDFESDIEEAETHQESYDLTNIVQSKSSLPSISTPNRHSSFRIENEEDQKKDELDFSATLEIEDETSTKMKTTRSKSSSSSSSSSSNKSKKSEKIDEDPEADFSQFAFRKDSILPEQDGIIKKMSIKNKNKEKTEVIEEDEEVIADFSKFLNKSPEISDQKSGDDNWETLENQFLPKPVDESEVFVIDSTGNLAREVSMERRSSNLAAAVKVIDKKFPKSTDDDEGGYGDLFDSDLQLKGDVHDSQLIVAQSRN